MKVAHTTMMVLVPTCFIFNRSVPRAIQAKEIRIDYFVTWLVKPDMFMPEKKSSNWTIRRCYRNVDFLGSRTSMHEFSGCDTRSVGMICYKPFNN